MARLERLELPTNGFEGRSLPPIKSVGYNFFIPETVLIDLMT